MFRNPPSSVLLRCTLFAAMTVANSFVLLSNPALNRPYHLSHRAEVCTMRRWMASQRVVFCKQSCDHANSELCTTATNFAISETPLSRRSLVAGLVAGLGFMLPTSAWADFPKVDPAEEGFIAGTNGVKIKDYAPGSGQATKDGDVLRIQFALYLPDGTIVSRFAGVEAKVTLGKVPQEFPAGLEQSIKGMKVGGERAIIIPPEQGWTEKFRSVALPYLRSCSGGSCPLDSSPIIAQVKLVGFQKAECADGDAPISVDSSQLKEGKLLLKIGSSVCPEGNVEVTEERMRTRMMIDKLKEAGKITTEKQTFRLY